MRRMIQKLSADIANFIAREDDLILMIAAPDHCVPLIGKLLFDLDTTSPADLYLINQLPFSSPSGYLDELTSDLRANIDLCNAAAEDGDERMPALPPLNEGPPAYRLQRLLEYGRGLVDVSRNQKMIWGFLPSTIGDDAAHRKLLAGAMMPTLPPVGWMIGTRLIVRVSENSQPSLFPAETPRVQRIEFLPPPDIHERELLLDLRDPALPELERMQSLLQLAYIDLAHARTTIANDRFSTALHFFQWLRLPALEALAMNGLGDAARRAGDPTAAKRWFEAALEPAGRSEAPIIAATIIQNLGAEAYNAKDYEDAASCYEDLAHVKRVSLDEIGLVEALEWRGRSLAALERWPETIRCWEEAAAVGEQFEMHDAVGAILPELKKAYETTNQTAKLESFAQVWPYPMEALS